MSSVLLNVMVLANSGVTAIGDLTLAGDGGLLRCRRVSCARFQCQGPPVGTLTVSADGFAPATVTFAPPPSGPCACGVMTSMSTELVPIGGGPALMCDLLTGEVVPVGAACGSDDDPLNCGSCGHVCRRPDFGTAMCSKGQCVPSLSQCFELSAVTNCDALCGQIGEECVPNGCGGSTISFYPGIDLCATLTSGAGLQLDCAMNTGPVGPIARCCCR